MQGIILRKKVDEGANADNLLSALKCGCGFIA